MARLATLRRFGKDGDMSAILPREGFKLEGGIRGKITGYSPASQRRLRFLLNTLHDYLMRPGSPWPVFFTLTLPGDWERIDYHGAMENLKKRFRRAWPDSFLIWVLEYQKRGAPHFQGLVCLSEGDWTKLKKGLPPETGNVWEREQLVKEIIEYRRRLPTPYELYGPAPGRSTLNYNVGRGSHFPHPLERWFVKKWQALVGKEVWKIQAEYMRDPRSKYIAKEVSKMRQKEGETIKHLGGQYWGVWNRKALQAVSVGPEDCEISSSELASFLQDCDRYWTQVSEKAGFKLTRTMVKKPSEVTLCDALRARYPKIAAEVDEEEQVEATPTELEMSNPQDGRQA